MFINPKVIRTITELASIIDVAWINKGILGSHDQNRVWAKSIKNIKERQKKSQILMYTSKMFSYFQLWK